MDPKNGTSIQYDGSEKTPLLSASQERSQPRLWGRVSPSHLESLSNSRSQGSQMGADASKSPSRVSSGRMSPLDGQNISGSSIEGEGQPLLDPTSDKPRRQTEPFVYQPIRHGPSRQQQRITAHGAHSRYQYYSRLAPANQPDAFIMPRNVVPPVDILVIGGPRKGKQSSLVTILSLWNTMMGSSILAMPWAIQQAGFGLGIGIVLAMGFLTFYTCHMILVAGKGGTLNGLEVEFPDVCRHFLGEKAYYVAVVFSILTLVGASMVYWVLMSGFFYNTIDFFHDPTAGHNHTHHMTTTLMPTTTANMSWLDVGPTNATSLDHTSTWAKVWTPKYAAIFLSLVIFPLINFKSLTFFTKFNSLGILSLAYMAFFIIFNAAYGNNYEHSPVGGWHMDNVPWARAGFASLSGVLSLSFFIHNGCLSIMRNQAKPENNSRDLALAYMLVCATYLFIGITYYVTFKGPKDQINNNLLHNFTKTDGNFVLSLIAQIFLLIQMITVYPLLQYITRFQVMTTFFGSQWPSTAHVVVLNLTTTLACVLIGVFYPNIGDILRFSGALCGFAYVFVLPCLVELERLKRENRPRTWQFFVNGFLMCLGCANFIAQFFQTS